MLLFLNLGWKKFSVETDPIHLWVSPTSSPVLEKTHFDENFGPFFRPQQIFITSSSLSSSSSIPTPTEPAPSLDRLTWWLSHEQTILSLQSTPNNYTYQDVCYSPAGPGTPCVLQSVSVWFDALSGGEVDEDWKEVIESCADQPADCLAESGMPLDPRFVLGGREHASDDWVNAKSLITTFVLEGTLDEGSLAKAEEWERALRTYLTEVVDQPDELKKAHAWIAFSTGVSLEEELNKASNLDKAVVGASYLGMLVYVTLTLGASHGGGLWALVKELSGIIKGPGGRSERINALGRGILINSKFSLGFFGILVVLISISTSVGVFSVLGVKVTLIIAEVIPFLVLAVGVGSFDFFCLLL